MSSKRNRRVTQKTYSEVGRFSAIPHAVLINYRYRALSSTARSLLMDLTLQLGVANNGDISTAQKILEPLGWKDSTRKRALDELRHNDLVWLTRQGGKNRCSLYAFTWRSIDECGGKLESKPTSKPPINYQKEFLDLERDKRKPFSLAKNEPS